MLTTSSPARAAGHALEAALAMLLRPLVRLLLRRGQGWGAFEAVAKRVFAEVAYQEFALPGRKPSISRAAILSGLTRKEAQRLLDAEAAARNADDDAERRARHNRATRVLTGWARDPDFHDGRGRPRALAVDSPTGFAALVRRHSGDMPVRALLDELLRVGAVTQDDDGRVHLTTRAYIPQGDGDEKLGFLGRDVADLVATIDHNLAPGATAPRFQRKVMYHHIPADVLPAFQQFSAAHAQQLLERLDHWLAARAVAGPPGSAHARVGVGIYYFEEPEAPAASPAGDA